MNQPKFPASSRNADKFVVRLLDGMRERISVVAKEHHRSMNSEIIARLEESLIADEGAASINADAHTLTASEKHMIKAFRGLSAGQQKALMELLVPQEGAGSSVPTPRSKVA